MEIVDQRGGIGGGFAMAYEVLAECRLDAFRPLYEGAVEVEDDDPGGGYWSCAGL